MFSYETSIATILDKTVETLHLVHTFISLLSLWSLPLPQTVLKLPEQITKAIPRSLRNIGLGGRREGRGGGIVIKEREYSFSQQALSKVVHQTADIGALHMYANSYKKNTHTHTHKQTNKSNEEDQHKYWQQKRHQRITTKELHLEGLHYLPPSPHQLSSRATLKCVQWCAEHHAR